MPDSREEILNAALQLSEADRLVIANRLLDTLSEDVPGLAMDDPALAAELDRRSGGWIVVRVIGRTPFHGMN